MVSVICVTKNRPQNIARLLESAEATGSDYEFIFVIDKGNTTSVPLSAKYTIVEQEGRVFNDMVNVGVPAAKSDILFLIGDDCIFRTKGWDTAMEQACARYPDGIVLVHPNDLVYPDGRLATHFCITKQWVATLGYVTPPIFEVEYGDTWVTELARRVNRKVFLPDVIVEHMHWYHGKAPMDETYAYRRQFCGASAKTWATTQNLRDADVKKLQERIAHHV